MLAAAQPDQRLPADRAFFLALAERSQRIDGQLQELRPLGRLAVLGIGLGQVQEVDALCQLGLQPGLGQNLLFGLGLCRNGGAGQ